VLIKNFTKICLKTNIFFEKIAVKLPHRLSAGGSSVTNALCWVYFYRRELLLRKITEVTTANVLLLLISRLAFSATIFLLQTLVLGLSTHLFVKAPRTGDSKETFLSLSQAAACYYQSDHSKVEAIPLSSLPKYTTKANLPAYLHTIPVLCWTSSREGLNTSF